MNEKFARQRDEFRRKLDNQQAGFEKQIGHERRSSKARAVSFEERFAALEQRFTASDERCAALEERCAASDERCAALEEQCAQQEQDLGVLRKRVDEMESGLNARELAAITERLLIDLINSLLGGQHRSLGQFLKKYRGGFKSDIDAALSGHREYRWLCDIDRIARVLDLERDAGNFVAHAGRPSDITRALDRLALKINQRGDAGVNADFEAWLRAHEEQIRGAVELAADARAAAQ